MTTAISSETCSTISLLIILYLLLSIEACAVRGVAWIIASCNSLANGYTDVATAGAKIAKNPGQSKGVSPNRSAEALSRALSYLAPRSRLVIYALPVTRQEIEQKMDELAREYRDTRDPEIP